jgi:uncharacterized membrane protein
MILPSDPAQTDFRVGIDNLENIRISTKSDGTFYWFSHVKRNFVIKRFVLAELSKLSTFVKSR